jgi:hypothetical protein
MGPAAWAKLNSIGQLRSRPGDTIYWFVNGQRVADSGSVVLRPRAVIVAYEGLSMVTPNPPLYIFPTGY